MHLLLQNVTVRGSDPILAEAAARAVEQWAYAAGLSRDRLQVMIPFGSVR
jgi:hypothetical protein